MLAIAISKQYDQTGQDAFRLDLRLDVPPGITILFGASGSGKSTLLKAIAGILRPDRGRIAAGDMVFFDSETGTDRRMRERKVGYVFQQLALFPHLRVLENVTYGLHDLSSGERRKRAQAMLASFGIAHLAARKPAEISGGEQQRVALARALVIRPHVLLLDEPLSALDATTKRALIADLKTLNQQMQVPVLYVTHSREEAIALGERVVVLEKGRILAQGQPLDVLEAPRSTTVAQFLGVENIFDATIVSADARQGTARCDLGGCIIEIPYHGQPAGAAARVAIRARDILLATDEPHHLSARNRILGTITRIDAVAHEVLLTIDGGVPFQAIITPESRQELDLAPGRRVWLVIKTHSCHLLDL